MSPTWSPVRRVHCPVLLGIATANLSASGSLAKIASAPTSSATLMAQSKAPGSSGFGNCVVGNSPSGSACSGTIFQRCPVSFRLCLQPSPHAVHRSIDDVSPCGRFWTECLNSREVVCEHLLWDWFMREPCEV